MLSCSGSLLSHCHRSTKFRNITAPAGWGSGDIIVLLPPSLLPQFEALAELWNPGTRRAHACAETRALPLQVLPTPGAQSVGTSAPRPRRELQPHRGGTRAGLREWRKQEPIVGRLRLRLGLNSARSNGSRSETRRGSRRRWLRLVTVLRPS